MSRHTNIAKSTELYPGNHQTIVITSRKVSVQAEVRGGPHAVVLARPGRGPGVVRLPGLLLLLPGRRHVLLDERHVLRPGLDVREGKDTKEGKWLKTKYETYRTQNQRK